MPSTESMSARERAAKILVPGATMSGFTVKSAETIDELDAEAYAIDHTASGARLLFLACEDENKAFAIGFKTPPANDTGVFHILDALRAVRIGQVPRQRTVRRPHQELHANVS